MTEEEKRNGPDKRATQLSHAQSGASSPNRQTQLRADTMNSDLPEQQKTQQPVVHMLPIIQQNKEETAKPPDSAQVSTVYQHGGAARAQPSYGAEEEGYPGDSRGLTSIPSGDVGENFRNQQPTIHNRSSGYGVTFEGDTATPAEPIDIAARNIKSQAGEEDKGRVALVPRTFQLEELAPHDEEQKKRMVVPSGQSGQTLNYGNKHSNSSRQFSPQDRYNRADAKGSPSPPVGTIKKGTVFKKQPVLIQSAGSPPADGEIDHIRAGIISPQSEGLDSSAPQTASHKHLLMTGHAPTTRVKVHQNIGKKQLGRGSSKVSFNDGSDQGSPQRAGPIGIRGQQVPVRQDRPGPADLDQIRDQHYHDYLQHATDILEQEQRRVNVATQDNATNSLAYDLAQAKYAGQASLDQHPSIQVNVHSTEKSRINRRGGSARKANFSDEQLGDSTHRVNSSVVSGAQRKHDQQIEEIRANHFSKISRALNPFMNDKKCANTVETSTDQARKRMLPNSYQLVKKQLDVVSPRNDRKQAGVTAVKNFEFGLRPPSRESPPTTPGKLQTERGLGKGYKQDLRNFIAGHQRDRATGRNNQIVLPKTQVQVPRELIMMKIAKRENQRDHDLYAQSQSFGNELSDIASAGQYMSASVQGKPSAPPQKQNYLPQQDSLMSMAPEDSVISHTAEKDIAHQLPFLPGAASLITAGSGISQRKDSYIDFVDSIQQSMYISQPGQDPHKQSQSGLDGQISQARLQAQKNSNLGSAKKLHLKRNSLNYDKQNQNKYNSVIQNESIVSNTGVTIGGPGNSTAFGKESTIQQRTGVAVAGNDASLFQSQASREEPQQSPSVSFHITELLERSINVDPRGMQIKPNLEFFQRSLKREEDIFQNKEVIIKNYRLRMVDANSEISENDRKLMVRNKGSKIYVSNSLIKPEIYRYSTKVSDAITEVFHVMREDKHQRNSSAIPSTAGLPPRDFESLNFQDQVDYEERLQEKESQEQLLMDAAQAIVAFTGIGQERVVTRTAEYEPVEGDGSGDVQQYAPGYNAQAYDEAQLDWPQQLHVDSSGTGQVQSSAGHIMDSGSMLPDSDRKTSVQPATSAKPTDAHHSGRASLPMPDVQQCPDTTLDSGLVSPAHTDRRQQESRFQPNSSVDMSLGTGRGAYYDQEELQAVQISIRVYEKWVKGMRSEGAESELAPPKKKILANGEPIAPSIKDINYSIMLKEGKHDLLKQREVPYEKMTAMTQFTTRPYIHLMRAVVVPKIRGEHQAFMQATTKFVDATSRVNQLSHAVANVQMMNEEEFMQGVRFANTELTHLDTHLIHDGNLTPNYFMTDETSQTVARRLEEQHPRPLKGSTRYVFRDGAARDIDIEIIKYDQYLHKFHIVNRELGISLYREKPLFTLEEDMQLGILNYAEAEKLKRDAISMRAESKQYLRVARLIQCELLQRYAYISMKEHVREAIYHRVALDLVKYPRRSVRKIILQVEALYIFSILKSMLASQANDPFIRNMFFNFKISVDSPALKYRPQNIILKQDLPGVAQFKMAGARDELEANSLIFSNKKYIKMPQTLQAVKIKAIGKLGLFQAPLNLQLLLSSGGDAYKKYTTQEIETLVNVYPLEHEHFVQAQKVVSQYFNQNIRGKWSENIALDVGKTILEDFDIREAESMTEDQISPALLRLFYQIKGTQTTELVGLFEKGMRDFLRFLLGFANRNEEILNSPIVNTIRHATSVRLSRTDPNEVDFDDPVNGICNDLDLIPLQFFPFCHSKITCQSYGKQRKKKMRFVAEPDLDTIQKDIFSIVHSMHDGLKGIKRVDAIIIPYLQRKTTYLLPPDLKKNKKLNGILKMCKALLEQCCKSCKNKLTDFNKYTSLFDKKLETIVLELKKQSFLQANEGMSGGSQSGDDDEGDGHMLDEEGNIIEKPEGEAEEDGEKLEGEENAEKPESVQEDQIEVEVEVEESPQEAEDSDDYGSDDDDGSDEEGGGGGAQNYQAYKSVEVDQGLLREEINSVRKSIWTIRENIQDDYDFGLLYVDCRPFKEELLDHCLKLEAHLCDHVKQDFADKIKNIQSEVSTVTGRLNEKVTSIDDVIQLLVYIDTLKRQDNKVEEIRESIDGLKDHMDYIESLRIMFIGEKDSDMYQTYLFLRNWPRTFASFIKSKKQELIDIKEQLIKKMDEETKQVFAEVVKFKDQIKKIMKKGLTKLEPNGRRARGDFLSETIYNYKNPSPHNVQPDPLSKDGSIQTCFEWLAQETEWSKKRFDSALIEKTWEQTQKLNTKFDEIDKLTIVINKREQLLGINKTQFAKLKKIQDDLKPLYDLWNVSSRFNRTMPAWMDGKFEDLDGGDIEATLEEWLIELKRLQKTNLIIKKVAPAELLQFIFELLMYFKKYLPMIKMLRTRGMSPQHWSEIAKQLDIKLDRNSTTLFKLICKELHREEMLKIIKSISDQATREYAVECALDTLTKDVMNLCFEFETAPDGVTRITKKTKEIEAKFEEFAIRLNVLKTNPYVKNFMIKLTELEKTIKATSELLVEWIVFQRNWLYLNGIFSRSEIIKQVELNNAMKIFMHLDTLYKNTIKSIWTAPQVHRMSPVEKGYLNLLKKANTDSENARSALGEFLLSKRDCFPRLYFLSNEELIDIYGRADDLIDMLIAGQSLTFLQHLFEGVDQLEIDEISRKITGVWSSHGEKIDFIKGVSTTADTPEKWLAQLEKAIKDAIKRELFFTYENMDTDLPVFPEEKDQATQKAWLKKSKNNIRTVDPKTYTTWIEDWSSQTAYVATQVWYTEKIHSIFISAKGRLRTIRELQGLRLKTDEANLSDDSDEYRSLPDVTAEQLDVLKYQTKQTNETKTEEKKAGGAEDAVVQGGDADPESPDKRPTSEGDDGGDGDGDEDDDQADVAGGAPNFARSKLPVIAKMMRVMDRFRDDSTCHPEKHYERVCDELQQKITILAEYLKTQMEDYTRISATALLTSLVNYRDLTRRLQTKRVFTKRDFNWDLQVKYLFPEDQLRACVKMVEDKGGVSMLARHRNEWSCLITAEKLDLEVDVFEHQKKYGWEYLGSVSRLVVTPMTERAQRSLLVALQYNYGGAPEGPFGTGKTETTKDLARALGRQCYVLNTSASYDYENIVKFFKGVCASGAWVCFDEFNRLETNVLSFLSTIILLIHTTLRGKLNFLALDDQKTKLEADCAVIITTNPGYAGRSQLPVNLKNLFRTVNMVVPDSEFISEILLYASGFQNASKLAQKLCQIQRLATTLMQRLPHISYDFGLRAIKAIIAIAHRLKMQAHNITESELPDIINDSAIDNVPWRGNQMIAEVQKERKQIDESQEFSEFQGSMNMKKTGSKLAISKQKLSISTSPKASQAAVQRSPSITRTSPLQQIAERDMGGVTVMDSIQTESISDSFNDQNRNVLLHKLPAMNEMMDGEFFEAVFQGAKSRTERQRRTVLQQIGISSDMRYDEDTLEEYIMIKAIRDYNHSKFSQTELYLIEGIIKDVFIGSVSDIDLLKSDYGQLKELILQGFLAEKLDYSQTMNKKVFQLYEISQVNVGCLLVGKPQTGKTSMIRLLESALNKASNNELKIRCAQERKNKLRYLAENPPDHLQEQTSMDGGLRKSAQKSKGAFEKAAAASKISAVTGLSSTQELKMAKAKTTNPKKAGKSNDKNKNAWWQDLYKETRLEPSEIEEQKSKLAHQGVKVARVNPKAVNIRQFFGEINAESGVWSEGIFTCEFRKFSSEQSRAKKWIHLDGPIDYEWVENLNSILDDNRRMNLPNGQQIKMTDGMCMLMETDNTRNLTPATISRCGMIYMNRDELNRPKHILNQFLQRLPPNLSDYMKEFEAQINWMLPTCLQIFNREKDRENLLFNDCDEFWIVQNLVKLLDAFTGGYWIDFITSNKDDSDDPVQQAALAKCSVAHGAPRDTDASLNDDDKLDPMEILAAFKARRLKSAANEVQSDFGENQDPARIAINDFASNDMRIENSLKFIPMWLEAFLIMSIAWTFQPLLKPPAKKEMAERIEAKIMEGKSDFATYQKQKKKQQLAKNQATSGRGPSVPGKRGGPSGVGSTASRARGSKKQVMSRTGSLISSQSGSVQGKASRKKGTTLQAFKKGFSPDGLGFLVENEAGMTIEFTDKIECPMFIAEFPFDKNLTIFDVYFNMDNSTWTEINVEAHINRMLMAHAELPTSARLVQNLYIPTPEIVRMMHAVEVLVSTQQPILVVGQAACGKSAFMKDFINQQIFVYAQNVSTEHVSCTHHLDSTMLKEYTERYLEVKKAPRGGDLAGGPGGSTQLNKASGATLAGMPSKPSLMGSLGQLAAVGGPAPEAERAGLAALVGNNVSGGGGLSPSGADQASGSAAFLQETRTLRPAGKETKLIIYLEDMHLAHTDKHGDQPGMEALRDYLTCSQWYSTRKKGMRRMEDINFVGCIDSRAPEKDHLTERILHKFFLMGMEPINTENSISLYRQMLDLQANAWPSSIGKHMGKVAQGISDLYELCAKRLKPTPMKVQYVQSQRECFKIIFAMARVEGNFLKSELALMKLFYHECMRLYGDRILMKHDLEWFMDSLKQVCCDNFDSATGKDEVKKDEDEEADQPPQPRAPSGMERLAADGGNNVVQSLDRAAKDAGPSGERKSSARASQKLPAYHKPDDMNTTGLTRPSRPNYTDFPIKEPGKLWFSQLNEEVEGCYQQVNNTENCVPMVENWLEKYNEQTDRPNLSLILYSEFVKHLLKILRAITQPDGHLIVVGLRGYGITQLIKLATFIGAIQYNGMDMSVNFTDDDWLAELRKIMTYAIEEDKQSCYVVDEYRVTNDLWYKDLETICKTQISSEVLRKSDMLSSMVALTMHTERKDRERKQGLTPSGSSAQQFSQEALGQTSSDARLAKGGKQKLMKGLQALSAQSITTQIKKSLQTDHQRRAGVFKQLLRVVRKNFHIVLNFSPSGDNFRVKIEKYKTLMMCSQLIWIQNLQLQDLLQIGTKVFIDKTLEDAQLAAATDSDAAYRMLKEQELNQKVLRSVAHMYLQTQKTAKKFMRDFNHHLYFTPCFFIRVFETYRRLLDERTHNVKEISQEYADGLEKIRNKMEECRGYHNELSERTPILVEKQHKVVAVLVDLEEEYEKVNNQRDLLKKQEVSLEIATKDASAAFTENQQAYDRIVPCLNEAIDSMQTIAKSDVEELRGLNTPPKVIKLIMKAICMILEVPPIKARKKDGQYKTSYWKTAIGNQVLSNPHITDILISFDRNKITLEKMAEIEDILAEPNYTYENAVKASKACVGLYKWVKAIRDYYYIYQEMEPRHAALDQSEKAYEAKRDQLAELVANIAALDSQIEGLIKHQLEKKDSKEQLIKEIEDCNMRKKRADLLTKGLSSEKQKQIVCQRMLASKYATVQGDVVLSAAYVTLASGFTQKYRGLLLRKWQRALYDEHITYNDDFILQELFGDTFTIREWHVNELPRDTISIDNAIIMQKTRQYVVCIDPQQQATRWLQNQYKKEKLCTTTMRDPGFKRHLEQSIEGGVPLLITEFSEDVDVHVESVIQKEIVEYSDSKRMKFCRRQLNYDEKFHLYMATSNGKPHFDVNISNHVCLVNFFVTVEGLTHNLLSLVVANERKDLEGTYTDNIQEMYEKIKALKEVKNHIIDNMQTDVHEILSSEDLIGTLAESKETAETIAKHLKTISSTNQFLQKAREQYAPVAFRASNLYFAVSDLYKVNSMYQYSLDWFTNCFESSLQLANQINNSSNLDVTIDDEEYRLLNNKYSPEQRIQQLIKTFTSELMKKVIFSCFQQDRNLVAYYVALRVLQAEQLTDDSLMNFALAGSRRVAADVKSPGAAIGLPWLNDMMWAELKYLSKLKPFNFGNLTSHIEANPVLWHQLIGADSIAFDDLPNWELLNLKQFALIDVKLIAAKQNEEGSDHDSSEEEKIRRKKEKAAGGRPTIMGSKAGKGGIDTELRVDGDSDDNPIRALDGNSSDEQTAMGEGEHASNRGGSSRRKYTEAEILADHSIWNISDDSDDDKAPPSRPETKSRTGTRMSGSQKSGGRQKKAAPQSKWDKVYNQKERNKNWYDDLEEVRKEEIEMARFLIEQAPFVEGQCVGFAESQRRTKHEQAAHSTKEFILRCQVELAILRCIRPDLVKACLHKIVGAIVDFQYSNFGCDILADYIDPEGTLTMRKNRSLTTSTSFAKKKKKSKTEGGKFEPPKKSTSAENDYSALIKEAYEESDQYTPIMFLVTHSVDVFDAIKQHQLTLGQSNPPKLFSNICGMKTLKTIEELIPKCAQAGDWCIIQHIHLTPDFLPDLERLIIEQVKPTTHKRFRVWITCIQMDDCSPHLLRRSIKVALQAPTGIKKKLERELAIGEKEGGFRRSNTNGWFHKNLWFGLCYLYAVCDGRAKFGALGWNVYSGFDQSDMEISTQQIVEAIKKGDMDPIPTLHVLRYLFSQINFGGKIARAEDMRKLEAHMDDLVNLTIALSTKETEMDQDKSHFGIPVEYAEMAVFLGKLPDDNPARVFGFNRTIERAVNQKKSIDMCSRIYQLNKTKVFNVGLGFAVIEADLESTSIKISLAKSGKHAKSYLKNMSKFTLQSVQDNKFTQLALMANTDAMSGNKDTMVMQMTDSIDSLEPTKLLRTHAPPAENILHLFVLLQKLLRMSSLDIGITEDTDRYDEKVSKGMLPERDLNDKRAADVARNLATLLDNIFSIDAVNKKFPIRSKMVLNAIYNKELQWYMRLLDVMRSTVQDLIYHIEGKQPRPLQTEQIWHKIQNNQIPHTWRAVSFQTAFVTLADFLIELTEKLQFWQNMLDTNGQVVGLWLPAFYDTAQLMNSHLQRRARQDGLPTRLVENHFKIMDFLVPTNENSPPQPFSTYLYGMWLQGAEWDRTNKLLIEPETPNLFEQFPTIMVETIEKKVTENDSQETDTKWVEDDFHDNPQRSKKEQKLYDKLRKAKLVRMQKGGASQGSLLEGMEPSGQPNNEEGNADAHSENSDAKDRHDCEEDDSLLDELEDRMYTYRCPVFKCTLRLERDREFIEKVPLFYIDLPSKTHPRVWVKRSVALLLEISR